jgi:hypothetical protein
MIDCQCYACNHGMDATRSRLEEIIQTVGWAVIPVLDDQPPYLMYTVGLHAKGLPELVHFAPIRAAIGARSGWVNELAAAAVANRAFLRPGAAFRLASGIRLAMHDFSDLEQLNVARKHASTGLRAVEARIERT